MSTARVQHRAGQHAGILAELRGRCRTEQQADAAERMIRALSRLQQRKGDTIDVTWAQLAQLVGRPTEGLTVRQIKDRYETPLRRTVGYLEAWGYVDARDALYDGQEGRCIVITLSAGVAQSVRATRSPVVRTGVRVQGARARENFLGRSGTTSAGPLRGRGSLLSVPVESRLDAARRASALSTRDEALLRASVVAALRVAVERLGGVEGVGGERVFGLVPELEAAPVQIVAREVWRALGHPDGRLSRGMFEVLCRASSQLDRVGYQGLSGPAASRAALIDLAAGDWRDWWHIRGRSDRPPLTPGGLACCLRKLARREVSKARNRRDPGRPRRQQEWSARRRRPPGGPNA